MDYLLYAYTPESVGGRIIYDVPSGKYSKQEIKVDNHFISIYEREKDNLLIIKVYEKNDTKKIISNVELEFKKHEVDDHYYPLIK